MGFGCENDPTGECAVDLIAKHMADTEPISLEGWLVNAGLTPDQSSLVENLLDINFWHYAMLNDHDRNEKYDSAIRGALARALKRSSGSGVEAPCAVDLGAGSGLLSMMAARAGAGIVHAIERSSFLAKVGPQIVANNGFTVTYSDKGRAPDSTNVLWHHEDSSQVTLEDIGGRRCEVLISETLGVSVFDEGGLGLMADLRSRLLFPTLASSVAAQVTSDPGSPTVSFSEVVPERVTTWAAVLRCNALMNLSSVQKASGFDLGTGPCYVCC